jgi:hypothetical protein
MSMLLTDEQTVTINCGICCEDGKAPAKDTVEIMSKHLQAYQEAKYPNLKKVDEHYYWEAKGNSTYDFNFAIFWSLKK